MRELLQQALYALKTKSHYLHSEWGGPYNGETKLKELRNKVIAELEAELAKPEQAEKQEPSRCQTCGGALPVTGRLDRTGECDCIEPLANTIANKPETAGSPMQKPLFWYRPVVNGEMYEGPYHNDSILLGMLRDEKPNEWFPLYTVPPQAEKQEPVAYLYHDTVCAELANPLADSTLLVLACDRKPNGRNETPLYTSPPRKEWVGLSDEEVSCIEKNSLTRAQAIRAIEAKLKEKNS